MKSLSCKQCGSSDFTEKGNLYVCMNCNSKYSKYDSSVFYNVEIKLKKIDSENVQNILKLANSDYENGLFKSAESHYTTVLKHEAFHPVAYYRRILSMCSDSYLNFIEINAVNYAQNSIKYFEKKVKDKKSRFEFRNMVAEDFLQLSNAYYINTNNQSVEEVYDSSDISELDKYDYIFGQCYNSLIFAKSVIDYRTTFLNKNAKNRYMEICRSIQIITEKLSNEYLWYRVYDISAPYNFVLKKRSYDPQGFYKKAHKEISNEIANIPKKVKDAKKLIIKENAKKFRENPELRQKRLNRLYKEKSESEAEIQKLKNKENNFNSVLENLKDEKKKYTYSFFGENAKKKKEIKTNIKDVKRKLDIVAEKINKINEDLERYNTEINLLE
ncbi:MAG: hypothetical protein GX362_06330 [Methanosarcinaceae archaeon]|nr:hypothetical protein [Methanosarcinaceae archaeon]